MIGGDAACYLHAKLGGWGAAASATSSPRRWPSTSAASARRRRSTRACEDYRASAGIDLEHDRASRDAGEKHRMRRCSSSGARAASCTGCSTRSRSGVRSAAASVEGRALEAGHFIPEELPDDTAGRLREFLLKP